MGKSGFYTSFAFFVHMDFHAIFTCFYSGGLEVLHSFHIAYNYKYYNILIKEDYGDRG